MPRLVTTVLLSLLYYTKIVYSDVICDKWDNATLTDPQRLVYIRQAANMRNVDLSYMDHMIGIDAIVQKETIVPFRRQWFYFVPCTSERVHFVTYKKVRALEAVTEKMASDLSCTLTSNASQAGKEEQLFGITPEGVIYNEGPTGIRVLRAMNGQENVKGKLRLTLLSESTILDDSIKWRIVAVNSPTTPQMPGGPTFPELIARLKASNLTSLVSSSTLAIPPTITPAAQITPETMPSSTPQTTNTTMITGTESSTSTTTPAMTETTTTTPTITSTTKMTSASIGSSTVTTTSNLWGTMVTKAMDLGTAVVNTFFG